LWVRKYEEVREKSLKKYRRIETVFMNFAQCLKMENQTKIMLNILIKLFLVLFCFVIPENAILNFRIS